MKIIIKKTLNVKKATAYLVFEKEQDRDDIQKFLSGKEFDDPLVNKRIKEYLKKSGILNRDGLCTQKGNRIKQTGKMFEREEGKYNIWYTEKDCLLDTKILYFERIEPTEHEQIESLPVPFSPDNMLLAVDNYPFSEIKLILDKSIHGKSHRKEDTIQLDWTWNNLEDSTFVFKGKLSNKKIINNDPIRINNNIHDNSMLNQYKDLTKHISKIFLDWNFEYQRLQIKFDELQYDTAKIAFNQDEEIKNHQCFDKIECMDIPLMPYDKENALKWRDWIVEYELNKHYFSKYEIETIIRHINQKDGFCAYSKDLTITDVKQQQEKLYIRDKAEQKPAYWHITAPMDLNPDTSHDYSEQSLDFKVEQKISFKEISNQIKDNTRHSVDAIVYYDKYVRTVDQQKAMKAFFDCFDDCLSKLLITGDYKDRDDYLNKNAPSIQQYFLKQVFGSEKAQHNRYLILCENKNNYTVWQMPASIDFISFGGQSVKSDTVGTLKDSFSYTKVEKNMLKQTFINFIETKIS
jgi:hypothetical protein